MPTVQACTPESYEARRFAQRAALGFSEAEIAFLFPAPITRRGLVHFRLLSVQFRSLTGAALSGGFADSAHFSRSFRRRATRKRRSNNGSYKLN